MLSPSIYIYILFFVFLIYFIKTGYWSNIFRTAKQRLINNKGKVFAILVVIIITVFLIDFPANNFFAAYSNPYFTPFVKFANRFGKGEVHFSVLLALIIISMLFKKEKLQNIFSISLMSAVFSGIAVNIIKIIISRARPVITFSAYKFFAYIEAYKNGSLFQYEYLSMPSGHTITVVAAVVPLYIYFKNKYMRTGLVLLALLTAFSRVYVNVHWVSDVLAGALLGGFLAKIIYDNNKNRGSKKQ